jgi:hypothetical protein
MLTLVYAFEVLQCTLLIALEGGTWLIQLISTLRTGTEIGLAACSSRNEGSCKPGILLSALTGGLGQWDGRRDGKER